MSTAIGSTVARVLSWSSYLRKFRVHKQTLLFLMVAFGSVTVQMRRRLLVYELLLLLIASLAMIIVFVESVKFELGYFGGMVCLEADRFGD